MENINDVRGNDTILTIAKNDVKVCRSMLMIYKQTSDDLYIKESAVKLHQCIEKYLKHLIKTSGRRYPKSHDLEELIHICENECNFTINETIKKYAETITGWYLKLRYVSSYYIKGQILSECLPVMEEILSKTEERPLPKPVDSEVSTAIGSLGNSRSFHTS